MEVEAGLNGTAAEKEQKCGEPQCGLNKSTTRLLRRHQQLFLRVCDACDAATEGCLRRSSCSLAGDFPLKRLISSLALWVLEAARIGLLCP